MLHNTVSSILEVYIPIAICIAFSDTVSDC